MTIEKWRRVKERLFRMESRELLERTRQELAKRCDAALGWLGYGFDNHAPSRTLGTPGSFFFAPQSVDSILVALRDRLPGRAEQIIQEAEQLLQHRFDLLGFSGLNYGNPGEWDIHWHRDAVHDKQAPKKAFFRVRYLDYAECGDCKITWELNRHQHLVTLAKAYRLTNDLRYVDEILRQFRHWRADNPYPFGINWASSLEVAFRSLSWIWTYHLLQGSPGVPDFRGEWRRGLALHGRHIERYLSTYFSPNTHLLGEAVAMFFLGVLFPELEAAGRWKSLGWQIIQQEAGRQVRADGFHFEQSTYYHVYALDFFLHAAILASKNDIPTPKSFEDTLEKMLTALCMLARNGAPPRLGDDDGGRLFDPRRNQSEHLLDPLATGAVLFHRGDFKSAAGKLQEEILWLLGVEGVQQWDALQATAVPRESCALPEAGLYLLTAENTQLVINAGLLGARSGGHGHADALSVTLQSRGHCLLIDPGTYQYVGPDSDRDLFRGTGMHNTVCVDGKNQAEPSGPFSWNRLTQSHVERWIRGRNFDLLIASHAGYQPSIHRRCVFSLRNGIFLVRDVVEGQGRHRIDVAWHLGPEMQALENGVFRMNGAGLSLAVLPALGTKWTSEARPESWSPAYGQKAPSAVLNFSADILLPAEFATLLATWEGAHPGIRSFTQIEEGEDEGPGLYRYAVDANEYLFVFGKNHKPWRRRSLSSDAEFVCWNRNAAGQEHLILCGGGYVQTDHGCELRCSHPVEWAELILNENGRTVFSSDKAAILEAPAAMQQPEVAAPTAE